MVICNLKGPSDVRIYPRLGIMTGCENPQRFSALDVLINKNVKNMVQKDCFVTFINRKKRQLRKNGLKNCHIRRMTTLTL